MAGEVSEQDLRRKAEKRVEETQAFKANLVSYLSVNLLIFIIWLVVALAGGTWFPWFLFPLVGWGIGVAFHGWSVHSDSYGESHEKRVQEEMERMKAAQSGVTDKEQE